MARAHASEGRPAAGWRDVWRGVKRAVFTNEVGLRASGVAFFGVLSLFPAVGAVIAVAAFFLDPSVVSEQIDEAGALLPVGVAAVLREQADQIMSDESGAAWLAAGFALGGLLIAAQRAVKMLMHGVNLAYGLEERRGFWRWNMMAVALTLLIALGAVLAFAAVVAAPAVYDRMNVYDPLRYWIVIGRWPVLAVLSALALALAYRIAASAKLPWRRCAPGAVVATALWVAMSIAISIYVANFGRFNATYGVIGGVMILMLWMWLTAFIVLCGAEVNGALGRLRGGM